MSDIWFPFTANTLPDTLRPSAKSDFLNAQQLVLTKALSLEQEDRKHRHFSDPAELPFTKIAELGRGGFGVVDRVVSTISHREYARKRIPRAQTFHNNRKILKDFENELSNLKKLSHYHIVELVGSYTDSRSVCLLMAPIADCNLKEYLDAQLTTERRSPLCTFFGCLTSAIHYLHENRVRHKDIKPQNVLVRGDDHVYLTDFGLALDYSEAGRSTTTAEVVKSPRYCSPELAAYRPRNTASDIWSLGCVFLEMWTVIRERTVTELTAHLESTGSRVNLYHSNIEGINSWCSLNATRLNTGVVDAPLTWIENILVEAPDRRWTASFLLDQIQEASNGPSSHPVYCGTCCLEGSGLVGTVHSPAGTDETFYGGAEDKSNGLDASELASLTTSLALAAKNHSAAEHRTQHDEEPHRQTSRTYVEEKGTTIHSRRDPTKSPRRKVKDWEVPSIGSSSNDSEYYGTPPESQDDWLGAPELQENEPSHENIVSQIDAPDAEPSSLDNVTNEIKLSETRLGGLARLLDGLERLPISAETIPAKTITTKKYHNVAVLLLKWADDLHDLYYKSCVSASQHSV